MSIDIDAKEKAAADFENDSSLTPEQRLERVRDYAAEVISERRNDPRAKLALSKADSKAVIEIYKCSGKTEADFEALKELPDSDRTGSMQYMLRVSGIKSIGGLNEWAGIVTRRADRLIRLQKEGRNELTRGEFASLVKMKETPEREARPLITAVLSLFAEGCGDDFPAKELIPEFLETAHPKDIPRLYRMILSSLAPKFPSQEKTQKAPSNIPSDTAKLIEQNEQLRAELEEVYSRLNSYEELVEELQGELTEEALTKFLARMNSQEAGMLLDQFAQSEADLKKKISEGYKIPSEVRSVQLCVRVFMRAMRDVFGVSQVLKAGTKINITLEESEKYNYIGSDFTSYDEVHTVEVVSPGWQRGGEIFSQPKVIEC